MANQLTKLTSITYVPAVPERLPQAAYCIPGSPGSSHALRAWTAYLQGKPYESQFLICFPATPYSPGRDAVFNTSANLGWNSGAVSIFSAPDDCVLSCKIPLSALGVLVGLQQAELPAAQFGGVTHGLLMASDTIRVIEAGVEKADSGITLGVDTLLRIRRVGGVVTYRVDGWEYNSVQKSRGPVRMAAVLYAAGDSVDDPEFAPLTTMRAVSTWGWGDALSRRSISAKSGWGWASSATMGDAQVSVSLPLLLRMSEGDYSEAAISVGGVQVTAHGGMPVLEFAGLSMLIPFNAALQGNAVLGGDLAVPLRLDVLGADFDYGMMAGDVGAVAIRALDTGEGPGAGSYMEQVRLTDRFSTDPVIYAAITSDLAVGGSFEVLMAVDAELVDLVVVGSSFSAEAVLLAMIQSGVRFSDNASAVGAELLQYAINIATGAVSPYAGFGFKGFAKAGMQTYGFRRDGVYRLGAVGDDGALLSAAVELAAQDFGAANHKRLDSLLIGAATDGQMFVRIVDDNGKETTHPVEIRGSEVRAKLPKGRNSRFWRAQIIIEEATEARIDNVEWVYGVTGRSITKSR